MQNLTLCRTRKWRRWVFRVTRVETNQSWYFPFCQSRVGL